MAGGRAARATDAGAPASNEIEFVDTGRMPGALNDRTAVTGVPLSVSVENSGYRRQ